MVDKPITAGESETNATKEKIFRSGEARFSEHYRDFTNSGVFIQGLPKLQALLSEDWFAKLFLKGPLLKRTK